MHIPVSFSVAVIEDAVEIDDDVFPWYIVMIGCECGRIIKGESIKEYKAELFAKDEFTAHRTVAGVGRG